MKIKFYILRGSAIFFGITTLVLGIIHCDVVRYSTATGRTSDIWGFTTTKLDYDTPLFITMFDAIPRLTNMLTPHNIIGLIGFVTGITITYGLWQLSERYK